LLPTVSIVEQTMGQARHSMAIALAGAALIVAGLLAHLLWFSADHGAAAQRHATAQRLAGDVRLADQFLTSTAQMAVVTGERVWVDRFDRHLPELEVALAQARMLAPPEVAQRFDEQTRAATEELTNLRLAVFEALSVGAPDVASTRSRSIARSCALRASGRSAPRSSMR
jgi:fructose-specific component phosphotransferase system IIB-like protein